MMLLELRPLELRDAEAAATIHAYGQPGTFLTSLGPAFLCGMYRQLAVAPDCFGFVALHQGLVEGVVVGVPANGGVLRRVIWRSGMHLMGPLLGAVLRRPALLAKAWQTLSYGRQFRELPREAELLFIGVRPGEHGQGVGRALFRALAESARQRDMHWLTLTVDDANERAQSFYQRNGMQIEAPCSLYGRPMHRYVLGLVAEEDA